MTVTQPPRRGLASLPPAAAHFCLRVERFCRDLPGLDLAGASVAVAYSGGADSKALLFVLRVLAPRLGFTLCAATLDHGLRPESVGEVRQAAVLCEELGIPFHGGRRDVAALAAERSIGLEEAGRLARLDFFAHLRERLGCNWVALGHQLNDLAEDSLMRLLRGGGWPAIAGMTAVSEERCVFRPLLLTPRAELESFLRSLGEGWADDPMNRDAAYLRNRVRAELLPLMLRENPAFLKTVADRWRMARQDAAFFTSAVADIARDVRAEGVFLSRQALQAVPPALRLRVYMDVLARLGDGQATATLLSALDAAWRRGEGGKTILFPGGKTAIVREGGIMFTPHRPASAPAH